MTRLSLFVLTAVFLLLQDLSHFATFSAPNHGLLGIQQVSASQYRQDMKVAWVRQRHLRRIKASTKAAANPRVEDSTVLMKRPDGYYLEGFAASKSSYAVPGLPNQTAALTAAMYGQYAGYIPLNADKSRQLFFWYYPSMNASSNNLVIWLNGGPGCSSLFGDFVENGPLFIQDDANFKANPYSWHKNVNMLYVEQPVGTGFSFTANNSAYDLHEIFVAADFYAFLDNWYGVFPETKAYNLYITGESYGGFYIPYIGYYLIRAAHLTDQTSINLRGMAIGNPVIDITQENWASVVNDFDFLKEKNFFGDDTAAWKRAGDMAQNCIYANGYNYTNIDYECYLYQYASDWRANKTNGAFNCTNIYNINVPCNFTTQRENNLLTFLNNTATQTAIHVSPLPPPVEAQGGWVECSQSVWNTIDDYANVPYTIQVIPKILDAGVPVILYDGDLDFILHYVGFERAINNMTWGGSRGFTNGLQSFPPRSPNWFSSNPQQQTPLGYIIEDRGLTYMRVFNAGHMVPADQPLAGQEILLRMIGLPAGRSLPPPGPPLPVASSIFGVLPSPAVGAASTATGVVGTVGLNSSSSSTSTSLPTAFLSSKTGGGRKSCSVSRDVWWSVLVVACISVGFAF